MAVTGIGTYASYTNSYGNTQNAGNKTGRTYKNAHEYKNYLTQKYDCLRSRDYSVNINSSLLSKAMGDEKTKQWLEYNLSLIPESIEKLKAAQSARGCKVLSVTDTINGYDSITEEVLVTDEVDPGTEKARKELEDGAVIGAGSVVTKDVEPYEIVVGSPAHHLKYRLNSDLREILLKEDIWSNYNEKKEKLISLYKIHNNITK